MKDIDAVPSNVQSARQEALLYVFEDNEAVIEMIMKGRSPTMRHVSRTHRVALDWLFDRINLDPKIQIKYFDTKNQLADILTKGNFTRDEWNHLLNLFNVSHFSSTACTAAMAKRAQQGSGEERVTAKSRPMILCLMLVSLLLKCDQTLNDVREFETRTMNLEMRFYGAVNALGENESESNSGVEANNSDENDSGNEANPISKRRIL